MFLGSDWLRVKRVTGTDGLVAVGLVMLAVGIAAYDWRIALIVCGGLLAALGIAGSIRGA